MKKQSYALNIWCIKRILPCISRLIAITAATINSKQDHQQPTSSSDIVCNNYLIRLIHCCPNLYNHGQSACGTDASFACEITQ